MQYRIFGDIHGCIDELESLLINLGYIIKAPNGDIGIVNSALSKKEILIFAGDLFDRGPNSPRVYYLIKFLREHLGKNRVITVRGNHDDKLRRYLKGNKVKITGGLEKTLDQFDFKNNPDLVAEVHHFLNKMPYFYEDKNLIVVHAAYSQSSILRNRERISLVGIVDNKVKDAQGFPLRKLTWIEDYEGKKPIFFGHTVHKEVTTYKSSKSYVVALDTGCVFGGALSCYHFPSNTYRQAHAAKVYYERTN